MTNTEFIVWVLTLSNITLLFAFFFALHKWIKWMNIATGFKLEEWERTHG